MKSDPLGLLGLCRRAGRLAIGFDAAVGAIKQRTARLIVLAADVSPKTAKEMRFFAAPLSLSVVVIACPKETLGTVLGLQKPVGVIAVTDEGFAKALEAQVNHQKEETI